MKVRYKYGFAGLLLVILLTSCREFSVYEYGENTFMVNAGSSISLAKAKNAVLKTANDHCYKTGLRMQPVREEQSSQYKSHTFQLEFRCYSENDPNYKEPDMVQEPNIVIENR